jgi:hypothetical protein
VPELVPAALGGEAGMYGAALLALRPNMVAGDEEDEAF